jgi:NADPH:quinone reductase
MKRKLRFLYYKSKGDRVMKAIRIHAFGGPEVMQMEEVPDFIPAAGQIVVRTAAVGVNPVDTYIRAGMYGMVDFPYTPGIDAAGEVVAIGPGVRRVAKGDRVYVAWSVSGTYGEKVLCSEEQAHPLPPGVTFAQGAAVGVPYATAWRALFQRAHALPGETLLVHGASGGVGIAAVQLARAAGLTVIGTGGTPRGMDLILEQGAHHVLDHRAADFQTQLLTLTGGKGVDLILEMLANVNLGKDLKLLATKGRVVVIGSRGPVEIDARDAMGKDGEILAMSLFNASAGELAVIHAALGAGLENGALRPIIGREIPLVEAAAAHVAVMEPGAFGKIVLVP